MNEIFSTFEWVVLTLLFGILYGVTTFGDKIVKELKTIHKIIYYNKRHGEDDDDIL